MEDFGRVFVMAFTVVSIWDIIKSFRKDNEIDWSSIGTAILGIVLSLLAQLDVFSLVGITFVVPFVGQILTGFFISKGSNYIFDFITSILNLLAGKKSEESVESTTGEKQVLTESTEESK